VHPELVDLFGFKIAWYGVLITAGVMLGLGIATRLARRRGLDERLLSDMTLAAIAWGIVGARVFYVLTSPREFQDAGVLQLINIRGGGISIHGGVLFGILVILYYQWRYRINFYRYADLMAPGLALGIIGGRLGNFFNGSDTMGRITGWPLGFTWPEVGTPILGVFQSARNWVGMPGVCVTRAQTYVASLCPDGQLVRGPVHLTQLYGVVIGAVLLVAVFYWLRSNRPGWVFWQFILWYSILRGALEETFRLNPLWWKVVLLEGPNQAGIGLFTATQLFSIPIILLSIVMLLRIARASQPNAVGGVNHVR
jgi:phosphatidylglycerol:prolipoprotein diacylglycerol transferase